MSFEIQISTIADFEELIIQDTSIGHQIKIVTKGGILNEWISNSTTSSINSNNFENGWGNFEMNGFKSGKMSPFSCRLANGQYAYQGKLYTIEKFYLGKHALHGILYDALYSIESTKIEEDAASVILVHHYKGSDKGYPFAYDIHIQWTLDKHNTITVKTTVTNLHHEPIPIMDGWHPYFKIGEIINDYSIQFKNKGKLIYNEELLPSGQIIDDNTYTLGKTLGQTHLDDCWLIDTANPSCTIQNGKEKIIITPISNYPYIQLYTPEDRKSIAVENLSAAPNCFNNKMGLHFVKPHDTWQLATSYQYLID